MEPKPGVKFYSTHDLQFAAVLAEMGAKLLKAENRGRAVFFFEDTETLRALASQYFEGEIKVKPQSFLLTWKKLRTMISEVMEKS